MSASKNAEQGSQIAPPFSGGGEMGQLICSFGWQSTPLGPIDEWSPTLRATVQLLLTNCFPMLLWWGPDFIQIYNDAYRPVLGNKHPRAALGRPFRECWAEVFHVLGPLAQTPYEGGPPTLMDDIGVEVNRFGFAEEAHFTIGYSPVPDPTVPSGIGGVLATVHEITEKVLNDRRVQALRELSTRSFEAKDTQTACQLAAETLAHYPLDIPFAMIYLKDEEGNSARWACDTLPDGFDSLRTESIPLRKDSSSSWPLGTCEAGQTVVVLDDLRTRFGEVPDSPWGDPPHSAVVVPLKSTNEGQLAGYFIAGISPRLRLNEDYRGFLELLATQIATAIANAHSYEEERRRNEALAELDRAKTVFFSNVSHEFRTPLTLMMAPIEDALEQTGTMQLERGTIDLVHRNGLRLMKLVNTLLDFSRIEAGRVQASYEPADLAAVTTELASAFRSAVETAGLNYIVDCPPLDQPVHIDRDMWEKIVLNLLSNAFKFTLNGQISVKLRRHGTVVELEVRDSGTGIPADDLPHIFERFYRVRNAQGRSFEGSGIGLALVRELVKLHGGDIQVQSVAGAGTTFTVSIPLGKEHLAPENVREIATDARKSLGEMYSVEASRWMASSSSRLGVPEFKKGRSIRPRILFADDNADMRDYVQRLLSEQFEMETVADGEAALASAVNHPPDLIITDAMMPKLDGFGFLQRLRSTPTLASIPVVLLSARAGEEAKVEGVSAGADDYLTKPFSARELIARIQNLLSLSDLRRETELKIRESEERFRALIQASSDVVYRMNPDWTEMRQLRGRNFIADTERPNTNWLQEYIHPDDQGMVVAAIQEAVQTGSVFELEHKVLRIDGTLGWTFSRAVPVRDADGKIIEWFGAASDVTARKEAQQALIRSEKMSSLGRMAATISHEINNPLESVTNLLYLAQTAESIPQAREHLQLADSELKRVAHITRQTLGFYRESTAPIRTSVATVLRSTIELLGRKIADKRATVYSDFRTEGFIRAVPGELRQVFSNVLANALDAIPEGGRLRVRLTPRSLAEEKGVRVTISDNGTGMPLSVTEHIFDPFFTTKGLLGTGLGLWVSREIVTKHHGVIRVRSRMEGPARGTLFSIQLPANLGATDRVA